MARKKEWDDDDGRTIASMSGVEGQNLFIPRRRNSSENHSPLHHEFEKENSESKDRPWDQSDRLTRQERKWYALGALKAALLIGLAFIVGLGVAILAMILIWSK